MKAFKEYLETINESSKVDRTIKRIYELNKDRVGKKFVESNGKESLTAYVLSVSESHYKIIHVKPREYMFMEYDADIKEKTTFSISKQEFDMMKKF